MSEQRVVNILHIHNPKSPHADGNPWFRACSDGQSWFEEMYEGESPTVADVWYDLQDVDEWYSWTSWFACVLLDIPDITAMSLDNAWQLIADAGWADALVICEEVTDADS